MWSLLLVSALVAQAEVVAKAPQASLVEYQARLRVEADWTSPVEAHLQAQPSHQAKGALLETYAEAQKAFLSGDPSTARQAFQNVIAQAHQQDWDSTSHQAFLLSALRLAQLAPTAEERDGWLKKAILYGRAKATTHDLVPPPLMARFEQLDRETPKLTPKSLLNTWSLVLINGVQCSLQSCPGFAREGGLVRITVLSETWAHQTVIADLAELDAVKVDKRPWATKPCGDTSSTVKIFWGDTCSPQPLNLNPSANLNAEAPVLPLPPPATPSAPRNWRSRWLWVGLGAAVVTAVALSAQRSTSSTPTVTYGD